MGQVTSAVEIALSADDNAAMAADYRTWFNRGLDASAYGAQLEQERAAQLAANEALAPSEEIVAARDQAKAESSVAGASLESRKRSAIVAAGYDGPMHVTHDIAGARLILEPMTPNQ